MIRPPSKVVLDTRRGKGRVFCSVCVFMVRGVQFKSSIEKSLAQILIWSFPLCDVKLAL